jgi:hypothetical protein
MEWNDRDISVRVYVTPTDGSATTHYVYDVRSEAWWPWAYANSQHNPFATHLMDGYASGERVILEGGQDGYLRYVNIDAGSDDSVPIASYIFLGPFSNVMMQEFDCTLREGSSQVTLSIHSASALEPALTAQAKSTGKFVAGRNYSAWARTFIANGYVRLAASGPWALEELMVRVQDGSETQRRTMRT